MHSCWVSTISADEQFLRLNCTNGIVQQLLGVRLSLSLRLEVGCSAGLFSFHASKAVWWPRWLSLEACHKWKTSFEFAELGYRRAQRLQGLGWGRRSLCKANSTGAHSPALVGASRQVTSSPVLWAQPRTPWVREDASGYPVPSTMSSWFIQAHQGLLIRYLLLSSLCARPPRGDRAACSAAAAVCLRCAGTFLT